MNEEKPIFPKESVAYGLKLNEFVELSEDTKNKLIILMSRIMESAHRNAATTALLLERESLAAPMPRSELLNFWNEVDFSEHVRLDGYASPSIYVLWMEYPELLDLGFHE